MNRPQALVSASRGIGDILRVTPLVSVCARIGYEVDVLIAPDYPDVARLIDGAPDVRRVLLAGAAVPDRYDLATFTFWSQSLRGQVRAASTLAFDRAQWLRDGDTACVRAIARRLGWTRALPPPFAVRSSRRFDIEPGTVALHPGCKPDWPWKKWHGFDQLAARLAHVAVIGSAADRDNERTYFGRPFAWPSHVRDFTGALDLADTAALVSQCAALVANDSGLMHLGVALGVPTFGIFGITSPQRESIEAQNMFAITKRLPCEPACRLQPWGRRDCEHHLQCLRTLAASDVCDRIEALAPGLVRRVMAPADMSPEPAWTN